MSGEDLDEERLQRYAPLVRVGRTEQEALDSRPGVVGRWFDSAGLPDSFILAVTAGSAYAIEDKRKKQQLFAGKVLRSLDRSGFRAKVDTPGLGDRWVPDGCQLLTLELPIEAVKDRTMNRSLQAVREQLAALGREGYEHTFVVARDAPTQCVIDALTQSSAGPGPTVTVGGQVAGRVAGGDGEPPHLSTEERLQKLERLRSTGVISDAEYTAKREQIIGEI